MRTAILTKPFTILFILFLSIPPHLFAQRPTRRSAPRPAHRQTQIGDQVIADLLARQPLLPEEEETTPNATEAEGKPPADDAPIKELLDYWASQNDGRPGPEKPSDVVRHRLLEAVLNRPEWLHRLFGMLPDTPVAYDKIYQLMQTEEADNDYWKMLARTYLQHRSQYFREELLAAAQSDQFDARRQALPSLAKLDWDAAKPIVEQMLGSANPDLVTLAVSLQHKHALDVGETGQAEVILAKLKTTVSNQQLSPMVRWMALTSAMESEWQGQDEWFLSLFADPTLNGIAFGTAAAQNPNNSGVQSTNEEKEVVVKERDVIRSLGHAVDGPTDAINAAAAAVVAARMVTSGGIPGGVPGETFSQPAGSLLVTALEGNYAKWIPKVIPLVGNADRNIHNAAVKFLVAVNGNPEPEDDKTLSAHRKDAVRALLPWLTTSSWASISGRDEFVDSLRKINLPEAVPGLLAILESENDREVVSAAVRALIEYKSPQAVGSLKRLLQKEVEEELRDPIITAIALSGGFSEEEMATTFEAYARKTATEVGLEELERGINQGKTLPLNISIGRVLYESDEIPATEGLAVRLFARAKELQFKEPAVAQKILAGIQFVPLTVAYLSLLERIGAGNVDADAISYALENRRDWQKRVSEAIYPLLSQGGYAAGIAAILMGEPGRASDILQSKDVKAQLALLAAARHVREKLSVTEIAPLLNNPLLTKAAESYLEIENSAAARNLIWARHPKQAWIVGEDATAATADGEINRNKGEKELQREVLSQNGKLEIYALVSTSYEGEWVQTGNMIVRVRGDEAELTLPSGRGYRKHRKLTANELQDLKALTSRPEIENLGPESYPDSAEEHGDGPQYAYLRLQQENGRRISLDSLRRAPKKDATLHEELAGLFYSLRRTGEFKIRYDLEDKIPGLEVLLTNDKYKLQGVAQEGNEVRLLIDESENKQKRSKDDFPYVWRSFDDGQVGGIVPAPSALAEYFDAAKSLLSLELIRSPLSSFAAPQILLKQKVAYNAIPFGSEPGIWRIPAGGDPVKVREGNYLKVVVTPDETWAVAGKMPKEGERGLPSLVRINLQTGEEFVVAVPADARLWANSFLPLQKRILLSDREPFAYAGAGGTFFLLDPATGKLQAVKGEFRPLGLTDSLLLQPTKKPNEVWASLCEFEKGDCSIGRYNLATFTFMPAVKLPGLRLSQMEIWADEPAGKVYFIHDGNLVRVPLPKP